MTARNRSTPRPLAPARLGLCGLAASLLLAACAPSAPPAEHADATPPPAAGEPSATATASDTPAPAPAPPASDDGASRDAAPAPRESLPEPGPAPINSPQAAATAVETYFALLDADRTADADARWGDAAKAAAFRRDFKALGEYHTEVDAPGGIEGAAGSMYVTVPVRFVPAASVANPRPRMGEVVVRRVNDVPGSTEAQRRWHIERIDVAMTPK
ncbi:hypothetical protein [Cognatilysobacter segetis]|uniref:hypothetical protein n=1 Tax=Cognatilysobacter segetis TaxID=2492394 RepID=UPI0010606519|nr:hypothetical protein [Lysobacter segetis]